MTKTPTTDDEARLFRRLSVFLGGVAYAAYLLQVPGKWIVVSVIILLGLGILVGVTKTRRRDETKA